jgi:hypothetical protein
MWVGERVRGKVQLLREKPEVILTAADQVIERASSRLVADASSRPSEARLRQHELLKGLGDPPRTRTLNLEIKSLLLYQLS